jgi:Fic family protein
VDPDRYKRHALGQVRRTPGRHGYSAFHPSPLPRRLAVSAETAALLGEAESALGRLDGVSQLLPNPNLLVRPYMVREAVASTRIEGTRASIADVYDADASDAVLTPDVEEVVNYVRATDHAVARLAELPLSVRLVREAHEILLDGVRGRDKQPGQLRTTQNWIGSATSTIDTATYVPPPPDVMGSALDDWERFVHDHSTGLPILAQCALMHYQFEAIHPFLDGNGRVGRLLIVLFLIDRGRLARPVLYVSPYLERHRDTYIGHLQAIHEHGDPDAWIGFFCQAVADQAGDAVRRARRLVELREDYRRRVPAQANAQALVDVLFDTPVLTSRLVEQHLHVTRPTALRLLQQLATAGLVTGRPAGPRGQHRWQAEEIVGALTNEN